MTISGTLRKFALFFAICLVFNIRVGMTKCFEIWEHDVVNKYDIGQIISMIDGIELSRYLPS